MKAKIIQLPRLGRIIPLCRFRKGKSEKPLGFVPIQGIEQVHPHQHRDIERSLEEMRERIARLRMNSGSGGPF